MSSTTNVQNLLTNVFHPVFVYDTASNVYKTKLELTNIDSVSANAVTAYAANIGDPSANVYVGVGAGNAYSGLDASCNSTDTFVGRFAGGSSCNVQNSVFLGYRAGFSASNSSNSISIGANTLNGGNSNIYIGCGTGITAGANNIFLGPGIVSSGSTLSNKFILGSGVNRTIIGDLALNKIGINLTDFPSTDLPLALDVNGYTRIGGASGTGGLGVNKEPGAYTLDVNGTMRVSDGYGSLAFSHDAGISRASIVGIVNPAGVPPALGVATLQVPDGYFSSSGTTSSSTYSISLKKGMFMVSAISNSTAQGYVGISYDTSHQSLVSSNAGALITSNAGSLVVAANTTWTVTYFPSP